jgi:predicted AAA+ superfamily ATPase
MEHVFPRIYGQPSQSFFLFGLRGVGKSTWAKLHYPDAFRIDLLDESLYQAYLVNPELYAGEMRRLQPRQWVVVDEIQRLPALRAPRLKRSNVENSGDQPARWTSAATQHVPSGP